MGILAKIAVIGSIGVGRKSKNGNLRAIEGDIRAKRGVSSVSGRVGSRSQARGVCMSVLEGYGFLIKKMEEMITSYLDLFWEE